MRKKCVRFGVGTTAHMVRADGIDLFDLVVEGHRFVNQKLNEIMRGGFSGQQFEFSVNPIDPSNGDTGGNLYERKWSQKNNNRRMTY